MTILIGISFYLALISSLPIPVTKRCLKVVTEAKATALGQSTFGYSAMNCSLDGGQLASFAKCDDLNTFMTELVDFYNDYVGQNFWFGDMVPPSSLSPEELLRRTPRNFHSEKTINS